MWWAEDVEGIVMPDLILSLALGYTGSVLLIGAMIWLAMDGRE